MTNDQIAKLEAENGLKQFDLGLDMIRYFLEPGRPFELQPSHLQQLQAEAVRGLVTDPGEFRVGNARITDSAHVPPGPHLVKNLVIEFCEYVNNNLHELTAFQMAAYVMWRLNWIHPFPDGNGRTSRMISYIVLSLRLGHELNGSPAIPAQIQEEKGEYLQALDVADEAVRSGKPPDLDPMIEMLKNYLARQLLSVIENADGGEPMA